MFSKGQQLFALFFIISFVILLIWSYRKDIELHRKHYKKVWVVALGILAVIAAFAAVTFILHT